MPTIRNAVHLTDLHLNKLLLQSAEELDKECLEARKKADAQGKQEQQENARKNA